MPSAALGFPRDAQEKSDLRAKRSPSVSDALGRGAVRKTVGGANRRSKTSFSLGQRVGVANAANDDRSDAKGPMPGSACSSCIASPGGRPRRWSRLSLPSSAARASFEAG
jgi:hypothetical protein